jgi:hypothetical protein
VTSDPADPAILLGEPPPLFTLLLHPSLAGDACLWPASQACLRAWLVNGQVWPGQHGLMTWTPGPHVSGLESNRPW